jgi:hypothetical protein
MKKLAIIKIISDKRVPVKGLVRHKEDKNILRIARTISKGYIKYWEPVQVIVTCDDEIKEGDWFLWGNTIQLANSMAKNKEIGIINWKEIIDTNCKKVLVYSNQISPETIQLLIEDKLKDGDQVEVETEELMKEPKEGGDYLYRIKDGIVQGFSNTTLPTEELERRGWKLVNRLKLNNGFAIIHSIVKEELLEDAARRYILVNGHHWTNSQHKVKAFKAGAKWQQEQQDKLYTEEKLNIIVLKFIEKYQENNNAWNLYTFWENWWNENKK